MNGEKITKSKDRVHKYAEVYTPSWLVTKMCDMLQEEAPDAFGKLESTFLEPSCGNGNFLVEILRRKLLLCQTKEDALLALSSIYGVELLPDNVEEAKARMLDMVTERFGPIEAAEAIVNRNIVCGNFLTRKTQDEQTIWFLDGYPD